MATVIITVPVTSVSHCVKALTAAWAIFRKIQLVRSPTHTHTGDRCTYQLTKLLYGHKAQSVQMRYPPLEWRFLHYVFVYEVQTNLCLIYV